MAIWSATTPAQSAFLQSSVIRENLLAVQEQGLGVNLLGDPDFRIWAAGDTASPSWWSVGGSATIARETSVLRGGRFGCKWTYVAAVAKLTQDIIAAGDWNSKIEGALIGQRFSSGCFVYTTSSDCILQWEGGSSAFSVNGSAISTGSWQWVKLTSGVVDANTTNIRFTVRLGAAGYAIVCTPTAVLGPIAPDYFIMPVVSRGNISCQKIGAPVATGEFYRYRHPTPFIVESCEIDAITVCTGQALIADVNHYSGTTNSMFTTRPQLAISAATGGSAGFSGTYRYRCFDAGFGTTILNSLMQVNIDQAPTGGGQDPTINIRASSYQPPFLAWRAYNSYK